MSTVCLGNITRVTSASTIAQLAVLSVPSSPRVLVVSPVNMAQFVTWAVLTRSDGTCNKASGRCKAENRDMFMYFISRMRIPNFHR